MHFKLTVNGRAVTVDAPAEMPLLWVLRDLLDLRGTKFGCGIGQCGACTVHLNGAPARACRTPVEAAAKARITTIEGLSPDGSHPVQIAWQEIDVPQCGYCQGGQIMAAAALLRQNSHPSDQDIDNAMDGNLCRCGTYLRIRQAIHKAAALKQASAAPGGGGPRSGGARPRDEVGDGHPHAVKRVVKRSSARAKGGVR